MTGGLHNGDCVDNTEMSINEGSWSLLPGTANLPSARLKPLGVSLNNEIFMIGEQYRNFISFKKEKVHI